MVQIDWEAYKLYKKTRYIKKELKDNFDILIDFLKQHHRLTGASEIFNTIKNDETGELMLSKRDLGEIELFEKYLFKDIKFDD